MNDTEWIQTAALDILSQFSTWENEAGQVAQCEQNSQAGDDIILERISQAIDAAYLAHMANQSSEAIRHK